MSYAIQRSLNAQKEKRAKLQASKKQHPIQSKTIVPDTPTSIVTESAQKMQNASTLSISNSSNVASRKRTASNQYDSESINDPIAKKKAKTMQGPQSIASNDSVSKSQQRKPYMNMPDILNGRFGQDNTSSQFIKPSEVHPIGGGMVYSPEVPFTETDADLQDGFFDQSLFQQDSAFPLDLQLETQEEHQHTQVALQESDATNQDPTTIKELTHCMKTFMEQMTQVSVDQSRRLDAYMQAQDRRYDQLMEMQMRMQMQMIAASSASHNAQQDGSAVNSLTIVPMNSTTTMVANIHQQATDEAIVRRNGQHLYTRAELETLSTNGISNQSSSNVVVAEANHNDNSNNNNNASETDNANPDHMQSNEEQVIVVDVDITALQMQKQRNIAHLLGMSASSLSKKFKNATRDEKILDLEGNRIERKWPHRQVKTIDDGTRELISNVPNMDQGRVPEILKAMRVHPEILHNEEYLQRIGLEAGPKRDNLYEMFKFRQRLLSPVIIKMNALELPANMRATHSNQQGQQRIEMQESQQQQQSSNAGPQTVVNMSKTQPNSSAVRTQPMIV